MFALGMCRSQNIDRTTYPYRRVYSLSLAKTLPRAQECIITKESFDQSFLIDFARQDGLKPLRFQQIIDELKFLKEDRGDLEVILAGIRSLWQKVIAENLDFDWVIGELKKVGTILALSSTFEPSKI